MNPHPALAAPRHYLDNAGLPGAGLPHDRVARIAARRAFVELKVTFQSAVAGLSGSRGQWLQQQVRLAEDPFDLWMLRALVFASLCNDDQQRKRLQRHIESVFPDSAMPSIAASVF